MHSPYSTSQNGGKESKKLKPVVISIIIYRMHTVNPSIISIAHSTHFKETPQNF